MRNEKEIVLSSETQKADHARRRLMVRSVVFFSALVVLGAFMFSQFSRVAETDAGKEGLLWGLILSVSFAVIPFVMYVLFAYTPIFKVMPKGEMGSLSNWGKKSKRKAKKNS